MIIVDKESYERTDIESRCRLMDDHIHADSINNRIIAICMKQPLDIISAVIHVRDQDGSVLLLNGETPVATAISLATKVGCSRLLYDSINSSIAIGGTTTPDCPSLFQFSSGTTGEPKLIGRAWQDIDQEIENYNVALQAADTDQPIIFVPVYHSFGLITGVLASMKRKVKPWIITDKNPKYWIKAIRSTPHCLVYSVPFLLNLLLSFPKESVHFHRIVSSGSPLSDDLFKKLRESSNVVSQQYGCSELGCIAFAHEPSDPVEVGVPLKHFSIPQLFPIESPGEIIVRYRDQNVKTGDIGYMSEEQSIHLLGRLDDQINVSGLKVLPYEVEIIIQQLESIEAVVVYKIKHPVWGEAIKAMIVSTRWTEHDIKAWCSKHLPPYKVPRAVEFVKEIPRMATGKISRKLLSQREMSN